ncbi:MAG: amidohydrolase family protein [Micropepsaceae bacterium]
MNWMKPALFSALAIGLLARAAAAEPLRYVALVDNGKKAGHQIVEQGDDGVTRVEFIFKDNGRGPELKEEFALGPDGTYVRYAVKGTSTFGAPIDETFRRDGDKAKWKSTSDEGELSVAGTALYTPLGGTPAGYSVVLAAIAKRSDGKLPLIPGGALSIRKVADATVSRGREHRKLALMSMTGVDLSPTFVWATTEATPRLFAYIEPGSMQLIEEGWEANVSTLEARQKKAEAGVLAAMQSRLAHPLKGATLIRNARVFDSKKAELGPASDVLLQGGRIVSITATGKRNVKARHVVDAGGRVLLPGLFDMHGHVGQWEGGLNIAAGVTTVRDLGNDNALLLQIMAQERAGKLMMPHIVPAGFIEGRSKNSASGGFTVETLAEAKKAVDWYAKRGFPQIKIYNSFPKEHVRATAAYAHAKGMRVSGHVPAFMRAEEVVEQGYDEIQHINQVLLNFFVTDKTDTRTLERFYLPAEKTASLDFDAKPVQDFIALLARKQTVIDPTITTFDFLRQRAGTLSHTLAAVADHLPPDIQRGLRVAEMNIPDDATAARYEKSYQKMIEFVGRLYKAGVPLVAGTDDVPGFTLHRELELYVQAGLTPSQALQVATLNGARYARVLNDRGMVEPGKRADLVLFDGDPTAQIADIRKVALVIKGTTAYYPSEIYEELGVRPFVVSVNVTGR